jgi:predicted DCC family thiol-disulfide oxidoreductase YuxK
MTIPAGPIWLYDGVCVLCSGAVQYVLRHEREPLIRFVAIQSREGRALATSHGIDADDPETFLFIDQTGVNRRMDGVLALFAHVGWPGRAVRLLRVLPRPIRDQLYDLLARHRYRLFGRRAACEMPSLAQRHRFVLPEEI